VWGIDSSNSI